MIAAVPDVNVYVSSALKKDGHAAQIFSRTAKFQSFTSDLILADVFRVLQYDRIRKRHK